MTKVVDNSTPNVGEEVTFTVTVENQGPSDATGVAVRDNLPSGYTFVSSNGAYNDATGIWTIGDLANGASVSLEITASVNATGDYFNVAEVSEATEDDTDSTPDNDDGDQSEDDEDSAETDPNPIIDLELDKRINNQFPVIGEEITFTIEVVNQGPSTATGVVVEDKLPSGYIYTGSSADQGDYNENTGLWNIGTLPAGEMVTLLITAEVKFGGNHLNLAEVVDANEDDIDSTPDNGVDTDGDNNVQNDPDDEDDGDGVPVNVQKLIDLELTKVVDNPNPTVGETVTFTLTLINQGPDNATGITVRDNLPSGYNFVQSGGGNYDAATGIWQVPNTPPGVERTLVILATVNADGDYFNIAEVASANEDDVDSTPDNDDGDQSEDDEDSAEVEIDVVIDLELEKSILGSSNVEAGDLVTFQIDLVNQGPSEATGVVVTDQLPSGYTYDSDSGNGAYDASTGDWDVGTLAAGESVSLTITATVNLTGDYINLAEVTNANEDDIDSTPDNGVDTDGDGNVDDDNGDEDDGDGVEVNVDCNIEAIVTDITCDDNGTASDPTDDIYSFTLEVVNNGGAGTIWTAMINGVEVSGSYGEPVTFGPYSIAQVGDQTIMVNDEDVDGCMDMAVVEAPEPCSNDCAIQITQSSTVCDDNGTPSDPSDDLFFFTVKAGGNNLSGGFSVSVNGEVVVPSVSYGGGQILAANVGPYAIADGPIEVTVTDLGDPDCQASVTLDPPATCSDECGILPELVLTKCDDNGTPSDPSDDVFTATILVNANNPAGNTWVASTGATGTYGATFTTVSFPIAAGDVTITFSDQADPNCVGSLTVTPPETCSDACDITSAQAVNVECSDNGTPSDPSDDTFTFEVIVTGVNTSATWTDNLGNTGTYGVPVSYGPFSIAANPTVTLDITDAADGICTAQVIAVAPPTCSDVCDINATIVQGPYCNDNGTPSNPDDDVYFIDVQVTGNNTGSGWNANGSTAGTTVGGYDQVVTFGPYQPGANVLINFIDTNDGNCVATILESIPDESCSEECNVFITSVNTICLNNGTPFNGNDDQFFVTLIVNGSNTSNSWNGTGGASGTYGMPASFGPFPISMGQVSISVNDSNDPSCNASVLVTAPPPCIDCEVTPELLSIDCDDNGTPADPSDDLYYATVEVSSQGATSSLGWRYRVLPTGSYVGHFPYDQPVQIGPFSIEGGNVNVRIADAGDGSCNETLSLQAPAPCSDLPCELTAMVSDPVCNNNGTPTDPSDDTYSFELTVTAINTSATEFTATVNGTTYTEPFGTLIITGIPADEDAIITNISVVGEANCAADDITVPATGECSDECLIEVVAADPVCDFNGTPDPSDDTYSFELTVTPVNETGQFWTASINGQVFTEPYGTILITGIPADENTLISGLADLNNSSCVVSDLIVQATGECSPEEPCEITAELIAGSELCNDNGTPGDGDDDTFTFEVLVTNAGAGTGWTANDGTTGIYGDTVTFGPYSAAEIGDVLTFTITDNDEATCADAFEVTVPNCTNDCNLTADVLNMACNDEGTPNDPTDDTYTFDLIIHGTHVGDTWTADDGTTGNFGDTISFGPYLITDGNTTFDVVPDANDNCVLTVLVTAPQPCSEACDIEAAISSVTCDDNGTPGDSSDDTFSFTALVTGEDISNSWIALDETGMPIQFGMTGMPTVFNLGSLIADGPVSITFRDISNPDCEVTVEVTPPAPCSVAPCTISADVAIESCDNNGNADPSDDTFTFTITVTGDDADGSWTADFDNLSGEYGTTYTFGPYPVGTDLDFTISNVGNALCSSNVFVDAPDECPETLDCDIISASAFNIECDDMGTAAPDDDIFVFQVLVAALDENGIPSTGAWAIDFAGSTFEGIYNVPSQVFEIPVDATSSEAVDLNVVDALSEDCFTSLSLILPIVPEIDCPDDTDFAVRTQDVQYIDGQLNTDDDTLSTICWAEDLAEGLRYYDTTTVVAEASDMFTFVLLSDMNQVVDMDGYGAIFDGVYNHLMPCCNLADTTHLPGLDNELLNPMIDFSNYDLGGLVPVGSMSVQLTGEVAHTLMVTTVTAGETGNYRWLVFSQNGTQLLDTNGLPYPAEATQVNYDLLCTDVDSLINNPLSLMLTGEATVEAFCGIDSLFFTDQLAPASEDCLPNVINRSFVVTDVRGNSFSCAQEIQIQVPALEDVKMPKLAAMFDCEAEFIGDANGNPHPSLTGYPYVQSAFDVHLLDEPFCNISADYEDSDREDICAGTYSFERTWTITDLCTPDSVRTFVQTIKVGDLTGPVVSCPISDHYCPVVEEDIMLFSTDPFDCTATIEVPMPEVTDACSDEWTVLTEVVSVDMSNDTVIYTIIDTLLEDDLRLITGLEIGEYKFRYTVTDDCGNSTQQLCHFRVADLSEPVAICTGALNVSVGGFGLARLFTHHIDAGSYDNCGIDSMMVRRVYERDPEDCSDLSTPYYSAWGNYVEFNCCDAGTYVTVELRVVDAAGNVNICWLDVLVEDKTAPQCIGLEDVTVGCGDLPEGFDPFSLNQLDSLFGEVHVVDNCSADAIVLDPIVDISTCGSGTITRRFLAIDLVGNISMDTLTQVITIGGTGGFNVRFPADIQVSADVYATDTLEGVAITNLGCDSLSISYTDSLVAALDGECSRILRTWEVTNWCDYDAIDTAVVIRRDEDCDGLMGEEDVWLLGRPDSIYVDADSSVLNTFPMAGVKDTLCDGTTNPEGYWRTVDNTGRWVYTQVIRIEDNGFDAYAIYLPADSTVYCDDLSADSVRVYGSACDSITISHTDTLIAGEGEACYRILRTWEVTNWDEYDGLSDAISIRRDEDCDGQLGEDTTWVLRQLDTTYVDADSLFLNNFPIAGVKDTICDNTTNPEGYWRTSASTGRWTYTQILHVIDEEAPVVAFEQPDPFCSFEGDTCDANVIYPFALDGKCLPDTLLPDSMVEMTFRVFLDAGADGMLDMDVTDSVDITGSYPDYVINGKFPMGEHILELNVVDACGNFTAVNLPFEVVDCFVRAPQCFDDLSVELQPLAEPVDIDGDGTIDQAFADITLDYLLEAMPTDDCNGPVGYAMNFMGEAFSMEQNKLTLTCSDNDTYEVEVWAFDKAENPYALQPDGSVGGRNSERCVTLITVTNSDACLAGLAGADKDKEKGVAAEQAVEPVLYQNVPNPFVDATQIDFYLPQADEVQFEVRNAAGQVMKVVQGWYDAGTHQARLDRSDLISTGIYYYTLRTSKGVLTKQLIIAE
ncbi:T9SS type A sorting domain-containing protein [Phaeodactylibacter sp.]|uniref:T9SS type A sorting domain-containing protein n=1 Tax=Phaeodactylibacter sp. TaxID=1940289 RepID=UPI0025D48BCC|nr:T9SS type A sorting domain-containing protein [Phaeodactylibacter sp.]